MYCPNCGTQTGEGKFCNQCGTEINRAVMPDLAEAEAEMQQTAEPPPPPPEAAPMEETTPVDEAPPMEEPAPVEEAPLIEEPAPVEEAAPESPPPAIEPPPPQEPAPSYPQETAVPVQTAPPPPPPPPMASPMAQQYPQQQPPPQYQHQPYPPQYAYPPPVQQGFLGEVYSKSFEFLFKKPVLLWALSVLCTLMTTLAVLFGIFPIIWLPIVLVLELGMANIFLRGYRGHPISSTLLFEGFRTKFARNAGGMGWRALWLLIWGLIPVAGFFIAIVKFYSYRFVPYIMLTEPDMLATEALKKSMAQTRGYKGKMFLADLVICLGVIILTIIFFFIARIPFIGIFLTAIYVILLITLLPLLMGTLEAIYYDKISKENPM